MKIDATFPGGNIVVEHIGEDTVTLHQDLRDTEGDWFYWCFRVTEAAGKAVHFRFTAGPAIGVRGPAVSTDGGATWRWLGADSIEGNGFRYSFPAQERPVLFGVTIPYLEADWRRFAAHHAASPWMKEGTLCTSRAGRRVELLQLGCIHGTPRHRVVITCRHHCCETLASFVLEGLVTFILGASVEAAFLRGQVEFLVVPFMDKDGAEAGDQGKNRRPRDHNRDYDGAGLYPETRALRARVPAWSGATPLSALDLHCPWLRGGTNEMVYLVGQPSEAMWTEQQRFSAILEATRKGPLPFRAADNLAFGQDWNVAGTFSVGKSFGGWALELANIRLATSIEIPYANAHGTEVNAVSARKFGEDLARALAGYLE